MAPKPKPPIPLPEWEKADAWCIQSLATGTASPEQQKRALAWIINNACLTYDFCNMPQDDRLSAIFDGRRFAGLQIVKLLKVNTARLNRKDPLYDDPAEPE